MKTENIKRRDPFVLAEDGIYYLYGTEVQPENQILFRVYESTDLENWTGGKVIFEKQNGFCADKLFWAPEVHKYQGKYYLFASFEGMYTQLLICDTPNGKFVPYAPPPTKEDYQCIDGTLYVDKLGKPYIVLSHNEDIYDDGKWYIRDSVIEALRLTEDLKEPVGEPFPLLRGCDFRRSSSRLGSKKIWHVTEGPFFYRSKENLYLLWSGFGAEVNGIYSYFQAVARSENGEIDGKWIFQDELLYENDGGHGMIFKDFNDNLKLIIHCPNSGGGSEHPLIFDVEEVEGKLIAKTEEFKR